MSAVGFDRLLEASAEAPPDLFCPAPDVVIKLTLPDPDCGAATTVAAAPQSTAGAGYAT